MSSKLCTAVPALLLASSAAVALAQQPAADKASAPSTAAMAPKAGAMAPASSATGAPSAGASSYRSAFEGYRPLTEQPVLPWRESNDVVGRIGGWQSYAREGQGGSPAGSAEMPAPAASQGKTTTPGMPAGHEGMKMAPAGSATPAPMAPMRRDASPAEAPMKMPAARPDPASSAATPRAATAPAAASAAIPAAIPGSHTGHKQP